MEVTYSAGNEELLFSEASPSVYIVFGEEDLLKQEVERAIIRRYVSSEFVDFDLETLNADAVSADSILSATSQAPFGSDRRVVVVHGMDQWRDRAHQSDADRLAAGINNIPESSCLILVVDAEEDEARRKTSVTAKLDAAVRQIGTLVACRGLKGEALADWIRARLQSEGRRIEREAVDLLIANVGSEMRSLDQEIFKLVNFVDPAHSVTTADVTTVVAIQAEDVMFQCVEAISRKQTDRALLLLHELHRHDPKPQAVAGRLLALLLRQFRLMWQAKHLSSMGIPARDIKFIGDEVAADLPAENSITQIAFKAGSLYSIVGQYSTGELSRAFDTLLLCDLANKGGVTQEDAQFSGDPASNLQLLVLQLTCAN